MDREKLVAELHEDFDLLMYDAVPTAEEIKIANDISVVIDLLKERDAVEPITVGNDYRTWRCPKCRDRLRYRLDKFCPHCGRPVKWE